VEEVQKDYRSGILRGIVLSSVRRPMLSMIIRKIINWCGTRLSGL
jgi:hypothetical protein